MLRSGILFSIYGSIFAVSLAICSSLYAAEQDSIYTSAIEESSSGSRIRLNYFGIFNGPSIKRPSSYQPDLNGKPDPTRPIVMRSFLGLGYALTDDVILSGNAYWNMQPILGQETEMMDPFVKLSHRSIWSYGNFNLYGDVRVHLPFSKLSKINDAKYGLQSVQSLTYYIPQITSFVGIVASERFNAFGGRGWGNDLDLYVAPNFYYYFIPNMAFTFLLEFQGSHTFGARPFKFNLDGADIEPGINWDVSSQLSFNPYVHIPLNANNTSNAISYGMMFSLSL